MKKLTYCIIFALGFSFSLIAQDEPVDPFSKKAPEKNGKAIDPFEDPVADDAKARPPVISLAISAEYYAVPGDLAAKLQAEETDGDLQWQKVKELTKAGKAKLLDSIYSMSRSGQRFKVQSVFEYSHPTKRVEVPADPKAPLFPEGFEVGDAGITLYADPVLSNDDLLSLQFQLTRSAFRPADQENLPDSGAIQKGDVTQITVRDQSITSSIQGLEEGKRQLLGAFESLSDSNSDDISVLAFVRWGKSRAYQFDEKIEWTEKDRIKLRFEWVDVDAATWHAALMENELSTFADESAATVEKWIAQGKAKVIKAYPFSVPSGQRSKARSGDVISYSGPPFSLPKVAGGVSQAAEKVSRETGIESEIDPVMSMHGVVDVNQASNITSRRGDLVYYRSQQGKDWLPSVYLPLFYQSQITTQVSIGPKSSLLVGVFTPPGDGWKQDLTRKTLFFIHNDTKYDKELDK